MHKYTFSGHAFLSIPVSASQIVPFIYSEGANLALKEVLGATFPSPVIQKPQLPLSRVKYCFAYLV